jgi:signal transduction histidine kinase
MPATGDLARPPAGPADGAAPVLWLKPVVAGVVLLLVLLSLLELAVAYVTLAMPAAHYIAGPIALGVMAIVWFLELEGLHWPLLLFAWLVTAPNLWLAAIGHSQMNFLFLLLTVGWVSYRGSRAESLVALAMNLAAVGVTAAVILANGQFAALAAWIPWALAITLVWLMTRALVSERRLAAELRAAQRDLTRLYEQEKQTALLEERQRLARELHDAVTQTLFSSSLIADVLPRLWERDPAEARRRLDELRELTRGALAEMRTLLYELRPTALTETPLGDLLRPLVEATIGRARLPVSLTVEGQRPLPPDVQVALYRVAQEALNNVAKHARAGHADVSLVFRASDVELRVCDDGQGFDPSRRPPGHLGVGIMGERAAAVGAGLAVASGPGQGTRVTVTWPGNGRRADDA